MRSNPVQWATVIAVCGVVLVLALAWSVYWLVALTAVTICASAVMLVRART